MQMIKQQSACHIKIIYVYSNNKCYSFNFTNRVKNKKYEPTEKFKCYSIHVFSLLSVGAREIVSACL